MAVTSIWPIKSRIDRVLNYIKNPEKVTESYYTEEEPLHILDGVIEYAADDLKTENRVYVSGVNCDPDNATKQFLSTIRLKGANSPRLCYHGYQSFKPGEVNAEMAHAIGVETARRLWGDRFEVVIATHCNTGVYHNHYVLNGVSFADGKRYCNYRSDYQRMREVSDMICREHGLSVIENPQKRGKNHGQYAVEQNGKPTHSQMIRSDIDRAAAASLTDEEFFHMMREMGYTIVTHGKGGAPLKHPKLIPPNAKKNFRFDTLGDEYTLEAILGRVRSNMRRKQPFVIPPARHYYVKLPRRPKQKLTGLRALYFRYCYELGIIVKHPERTKRVSYLLREDVIKLDRYIAEAKLLISHKIETTQDLSAYMVDLKQKIDRLEGNRNDLRKKLKQASRRKDDPQITELKSEIKQVSNELKEARKEMGYCEDVAERSEQVHQNLHELSHEKEKLRKEMYSNEHPSRSSGPGGQDYVRWQ